MKAILLAVVLLPALASPGSQSVKKHLWTSLQNDLKGSMAVKFQCTKQGFVISLILRNKDHIKKIRPMHNRWIVTRWEVGNTPPSKKGYSQMVYAGKVHKTGAVQVFHNQALSLKKGLQKLKARAFKNEKQAIKEYQEKADYCQKQVKNARECPQTKKVCETQKQCHQSLHAYQVQNPSLIVSVEYPGQKWSFVFDPQGTEKLKDLICHKT